MRRLMVVMAVMCAALAGIGPSGTAIASPAGSNAYGKCGPDVCVFVNNGIKGSRFVYFVEVLYANGTVSNATTRTFRYFFNGVLQQGQTHNANQVVFNVDRTLPAKTCIQGGIIGLTRSPCAYVP